MDVILDVLHRNVALPPQVKEDWRNCKTLYILKSLEKMNLRVLTIQM